MSPNGQSVYVANGGTFGAGSVSRYDVGGGGKLSPKSPAKVAAGSAPFGVAVSPGGHSVYVTDQFLDWVLQYDVGAGGKLSPKSPAKVAADSNPLGVAVRPMEATSTSPTSPTTASPSTTSVPVEGWRRRARPRWPPARPRSGWRRIPQPSPDEQRPSPSGG